MTTLLLTKDLYDVLNAIALKKFATIAAVSELIGEDTETTKNSVEALAERGLVAMVGETAMPTDDAAPALVDSAAQIYRTLREDATMLAVADKFEDVNSRFLQTMSAWQQIEIAGKKVVNDHTDESYDAKIISTIERLVQRLSGLLQALAEKDPHFATYIARFERALNRVDDGEIAFVSDPTKDSVHNVWFEFHEDLLRTLGRARKE
ncbi:hypothetical protein [Nocardia jiangxiensis]|uniref:hypothetical protein n=1 Tax=Nocardia jiangxiensis TaxID=282685 RepID=UPI0002E877CD|nr:hypothetical protein [Nocardia jiangxiensis]